MPCSSLRAPWVEGIKDTCLQAFVLEALVARRSAVKANGDAALIAAGDKTLEAIEFGRASGDVACRKAAYSIRKFDEAYMGKRP